MLTVGTLRPVLNTSIILPRLETCFAPVCVCIVTRGLVDIMISAIAFVTVAVVMCAACVLAMFGITVVQMSRAEVIERDGLVPGTRAPSWSLADSSGVNHRSPPHKPLQLVMFTDHSLNSFPSVADGLHDLARKEPDLEIVVLLRGPNDLAEPVLRLLGLSEIPVLTGSPGLYGRYNLRVTPFALCVDSHGRVRGSSLVNHDWQVAKLRQIAGIPVAISDARPAIRFWRRGSRVQVQGQW